MPRSSRLSLAMPLWLMLVAPACGPAPAADAPPSPSAAPTETSASSAESTAPDPSVAPSANASLPPKAECDAFMDVIARTTGLRASIQREASTSAKAAEWATLAEELATLAKKLTLTQPDLVIESAGLASRMGDLGRDLRSLEAAEKSHDLVKINAAHKRVLDTSEQVEVITREPAARCAGDTKALRPTTGRLPAAKIQTVVRDNFTELRKCYEEGLKRDAKLEGRVTVRFVIAADGRVETARDASSDPVPPDAVAPPGQTTAGPMTDAKVVACVLAAVKKLQFPKPDGGAVTVVYPFVFAPQP